MVKALQYIGQIIAYLCFAIVIGYFSSAPAYIHLAPNKALVKLSLSHAAQHQTECRRLTAEEIAELPPNMRRPLDCPRERLSMLVELLLDDELLFHQLVQPSGLARDGSSTVYERFPVEPGAHKIVIRLRDSPRSTGFDYELTENIELAPKQNLAIDFKVETGGFKILQ
ncbi:MAG: hypothetical protein OEU36_16320 [Gammaproteobacteria bacterium]|nr:hypothetical protein [Gammaproteobacteria bacterium]